MKKHKQLWKRKKKSQLTIMQKPAPKENILACQLAVTHSQMKQGLVKNQQKNKEKLRQQFEFEDEAINNNENLFEKKFTYLCAGTFLISIYLIDQGEFRWWLSLSWICLAVGLFVNVWSCIISVKLSKNLQKDIEFELNNYYKGSFSRIITKKNSHRTKVFVMNCIAASFFTIGVIGILTFAIVNQY